MSYTSSLKETPYRDYLPGQLIEHLGGEQLEDAAVVYKLPEIHTDERPYKQKVNFTSKPSDVRLPSRISNPLIPYPDELKDICRNEYKGDTNAIHGHHYSQLKTLGTTFDILVNNGKLPQGELAFGIDDLKRFARQSYSSREKLINLATLAFAKRATMHDLSIAAAEEVPYQCAVSNISKYTSFIIMIQRLRVHISKESTFPVFKSDLVSDHHHEAHYTMFSNGVYIYHSHRKGQEFYILACGGHFRMYHAGLGYWFCGPTTYLDYIFTIADILNNLDVLKNCEEYQWATTMFELMIRFAEQEGYHKEQVDFMKTLEGFLLNMSDYDENHAMNWKPILEAAETLWILDMRISGCSYDLGLPIALLGQKKLAYPKNSFFCRFIVEGMKMSRTHLQEISALHKLIFYAEVSARAGVEKFLKRVHTKRSMDKHAVKNITRLAKCQFFISYRKKHKMIPNTIGPPSKVKLLEMYCQKSDFQRIEALPLSWWDDMKIFDCMDNTMTDDPLEFAKDKGALKQEISFGPGDSRKELLQVIEKENYKLQDFFSKRRIYPKKQFVQRTCQKSKPETMTDPARLIEKEREQKWEARLFANGELSNKHGLSLVAARMKKALAYFDEQLMTPSDKKRKELIHEAARELAAPDNYSLLLDIEGHNQSMQYENTHELSEFIGNLFGFDGWGDLSHYFAQLTVYHYDEYLDSVIESHGQYGGIEGWLNPLWTLHTTLMMKLLRTMTDLTISTIMVYSDDVNAIVKIPQASEPMVQSVFSKIMKHCTKFGMTVKYSQTTLSKHRITMLRQHYADGQRADSTLKRLISVSAGNNPMIMADELEVSGICSSASSALEMSNHHAACSYLKNYKLGLLGARLPQMILSRITTNSMVSPDELPERLSALLYYSKADQRELDLLKHPHLYEAAKNDIASYLKRNSRQMNDDLFREALSGIYGQGVAEARMVDSPDRVLYLQVYDSFIQDLLFFWMYLPTSLGGLGASLHLNLMLSGHSIGFSKSTHYLFEWIKRFAGEKEYFMRYLSTTLSVKTDDDRNMMESRVVSSTWPSDQRICPATTSVQQSIKSMVRRHTRNADILEMFKLSDDRDHLANEMLNIFRENFHSRIVQFYHENTSIHFIDLLISKIETSSGLLSKVKNITRLRNSLSNRAIENIRLAADTTRTYYFSLNNQSDLIENLLQRKIAMFPDVEFIRAEEVLYDDKVGEVKPGEEVITIRRCAPTHFRNGIRVYDDPKVGNETLYKGELIDNDRMLGNKEELLAAKLVAVTKWFLMKHNLMSKSKDEIESFDCVIACNLALSTLTGQTFQELFYYAPTETGGEILHRIPNMRFSTSSYIRAEMNRSLHYTTDLNQMRITISNLVDSNVNFDYLRMRLLVAMIVRDKYDNLRRLVVRYGFTRLTGIKDVQFVAPRRSTWTSRRKFKCYGSMRGHTFSRMRFRYLSHSYLYEENVNDWALIPKQQEEQSADEIGYQYINDIIFRYSRDLDKDYMMVTADFIAEGMWKPLIDKLNKIDPRWKRDKAASDVDEIAQRLRVIMSNKGRFSKLDTSDRIALSLQTQCLDAVLEMAPSDVEFQNLVARYSAITRHRRHSSQLNIRLSKYQALLANYERHRYELAKSLIHEYILTFHFKIMAEGGGYVVDTGKMLREFIETGVQRLSLMIINPDIQVRMMILGFDYVDRICANHIPDITEALRDICSDVTSADVIVPVDLPSLTPCSMLTGDEPAPSYISEVVYTAEPISLSAMKTLSQIRPLVEYAQLCSTSGAHPLVFTSHTGSDSMIAQYGLFSYLLSDNIIDRDTAICDLTAGRGDGIYAARYLGLETTGYSLEDTFTRLMYHPDVQFKKEYDVFNGSTIKFINQYDHIHCDISFTGSAESNILDLVLAIEETNATYSIRLNSVVLDGYDEMTTKSHPRYKHMIAYATNKHLKPYQIYLIGIPCTDKTVWTGPELKNTIAFKSLALSYAHLLSPSVRYTRLEEYQPNSASIHLPPNDLTQSLILNICDDTVLAEQEYYLRRYLAEVGEGATFEMVRTCMDDAGKYHLDKHARFITQATCSTMTTLTEEQIGNVSTKSKPFHVKHIQALNSKEIPISSISVLNCDESLLHHLRRAHPVQEMRSWANILLGLMKFCRSAYLSGHNALKDLYSQIAERSGPKPSSHQREIGLAIKLLLLAASEDSFAYGIDYCRKLMTSGNRIQKSMTRTLRIYRLLSYLFPQMQTLMKYGQICIRSINAIGNELNVREKTRYKYRRVQSKEPEGSFDPELVNKVIEGSLTTLFSGLETYAEEMIKEEDAELEGSSGMVPLLKKTLSFDIGLEDHIERMVQALNLTATGPRGIIDLGDDDILENDDW